MEMKFIYIISFCTTTAVLIYNANSLEAESIMGGSLARSGQFKYQVSIFRDEAFLCGGGIIGDRYIITAAHCVLKDNKFINDRWSVVADSINVKRNRGKTVEVEKIYVRKDYRFSTSLKEPDNDIAVLKLKSGLGLSKSRRISKLSLASTGQTYDNARAVIAGFGYTKVKTVPVSGDTNYDLKYVETDVVSNQECAKFYRVPVHESYLCAKVQQRSRSKEDVCDGDSGGPLVYNDNIVIGILNSGPTEDCKDVGPGVYTRVSYYRSFIENAMKDRKTTHMRVAIIKKKLLGFKIIVEEI